MSLTRIVRIRPGIERNRAQNTETSFGLVYTNAVRNIEAEELFVRHYDSIRSTWQRYDREGILIFAFDEQATPIGELWLGAEQYGARAGVIGRHSECDLMIPTQHICVSLRHVVVLARRLPDNRVQIEVVDLATGMGFADEKGDTRHSVTSEGPMFLRIGTVTLFLTLTPVCFSGGETAKEAYQCLPERQFLDEVDFSASPQLRSVQEQSMPEESIPVLGSRVSTRVRSKIGPVFGSLDLCDADETPAGALSFRSGRNRVVRSVGSMALQRGVLIGRYSRCHLGPKIQSDDSRISRVHLLLIQDGSEVMAIDTASTNGTRINGEYKKFRVLAEGDELDLGEGLKLLWNTAN
jgi:hypothetical protein